MGTEVIEDRIIERPAPVFEGRALAEHANAGAVSIESDRAIAEAQGKLVIAKRFPRDEAKAFANIMRACSRKSLAEIAMYAFPRGGETVKGPSIRLAEELARCWGNMSYGTRELSRKEGVSEMEAFAWDEETNVRSVQQFTVRHLRDKKGGAVALKDERDIYELTANQGSRRLRARILAIIPPDVIEEAIMQCRKTLAGNTDEPIGDRVRKMVTAFAKFGVTAEQITVKTGRPLDQTTPDDIVDLTAIYASLRDGMAKVSDWFGGGQSSGPALDPSRPAGLQRATRTEPHREQPEAAREAPAAAGEVSEAGENQRDPNEPVF